MKFRSIAKWPAEVRLGSLNNESEDTHPTREAARAVVQRLLIEGLGGEGKFFPIKAWVGEDGVRTPVLTREERRAKALERSACSCVHFTGIQHDKCAAGLPYPQLMGVCLPVWGRANHDFRGVPECPKFQARGMEAAKARELEIDQLAVRLNTARKAITDQTKGVKPSSGRVRCPICNQPASAPYVPSAEPAAPKVVGEIQYSVAPNGHIHARCSTPNCVAWIE